MGKTLTAKDLQLDDDFDPDGKGPDEDSPKFEGSPEHGAIGAEAVEAEVEDKKAKQKKAKEDLAAEEAAKLEGGDKEKTGEEKLEYADQAAAEKAVKDAKKKISELGTKSSQQAAIIADLQKRVDDAAAKAPATAPEKNPWDVKRQQVLDETISTAAAIPMPKPPQDRDDPEFDKQFTEYKKQMLEYNGKVANVWGEAQTKISRLTIEEAKEADKNQEAVISAVTTALEEAGLINDKTSPKHREDIWDLFWKKSEKVSKALPMEDQIKETVNLCKDFVDELRGKERQRAIEEKTNQESLDVLGRGGRPTSKKVTETSTTMGDAQRVALDRRRLRHSP